MARRAISAAISVLTGGRPVRFGWVHFFLTRRWCHRRTVPGVTSRCARSLLGRCRISAASTARPAQSRRGLGLVRRSTATSCRSTSSSAFVDADERPGQDKPASKPDEDQIQQTKGHRRSSCPAAAPPASLQPTAQADFWHPTGPGLLDGWPGSGLLLADDGGDVVGGHAVQVQVDVRRPFDRGPRRWERLSGPRHFWGERGHGAGRAQPCAAPPPREQAHRAGGTYGNDNRGGDQEHVDQLGHGGGPAGHLAEYCRAPGCRSVWYRPRHDPLGQFWGKLARYLP